MKLKREVGILALSANIINIVIGGGIFILPATIADTLGAASITAYLVCGFVMIMVMSCFAVLGGFYTGDGGSYRYITSSFGIYPGFLTAILIVTSSFSGDAAVANAIADILGTFVPAFNNVWFRGLFFIGIFFGFGFINIIGIKKGVGFVKILTLLKLAPLVLVVLFGIKEVTLSSLFWEDLPNSGDIGSMCLILFFAFTGAEKGLSLSGEVKKPEKIIPSAITLSTAVILIIYILIQLISQGILGDALPQYDKNPLAVVARHLFGSFGFHMVTIGAAVAMMGSLSSKILSMPRVLFAASENMAIPVKKMSAIHQKYATPHIAILIYVSLGFLFSVIGGFKELAIVSSASTLLIYLGISFAAIKLNTLQGKTLRGSFKTRVALLIPIVSILLVIWILSKMTLKTMFLFLGVLLLLSLLFFIVRRLFKKHSNGVSAT